MSEKIRISRRQFIKDAAIAGVAVAATGALAPAQTHAAPAPTKWDFEADVVVVGFGGAGGATAIEAHDAGAKVIILEKTATPGGSTTLCAGIYYGAGTSLQKAAGIADTPDEMYKYVMAMGRGLTDADLARVWSDKSAETFEWIKGLGAQFYTGVDYVNAIPPIKPLTEDAGWGLYYSGAEADPEFTAITPAKTRGHVVKPVQPTWPYPPKHPSAPTSVGPSRGTGFFKPLWEAVKKRGIQVLLETRAMALVTNPATNEVLGVKAESKGATVYVKANKGVSVTTGGYSQNKDFCKMFCPEAIDAFGGFTASDTADGHQMGMAIGAAAVNLSQTLLDVSLLPGAIMVNYGGRRFTDETTYRVKGEVQNGQRNALAYQIFDSAIKGASTLASNESKTIAELAGKIGVDPTVLEDTVNFYNKSVAAGKDVEFGRTRRDTQKRPPTETAPTPERTMLPIKTPPFYAVKMGPFSNGTITMGGLRVNTKAQVLDVYGKVIPRLYAAGTAMGGLMGQMYVGSGQAISQALNFGRIAGKNLAAETPWKPT